MQDEMYQNNEHLIFYTSQRQKRLLVAWDDDAFVAWPANPTPYKTDGKGTELKDNDKLKEQDRQVQRLTLDVDDRCYTNPP